MYIKRFESTDMIDITATLATVEKKSHSNSYTNPIIIVKKQINISMKPDQETSLVDIP